jgi:hypothetical protein
MSTRGTRSSARNKGLGVSALPADAPAVPVKKGRVGRGGTKAESESAPLVEGGKETKNKKTGVKRHIEDVEETDTPDTVDENKTSSSTSIAAPLPPTESISSNKKVGSKIAGLMSKMNAAHLNMPLGLPFGAPRGQGVITGSTISKIASRISKEARDELGEGEESASAGDLEHLTARRPTLPNKRAKITKYRSFDVNAVN